MKDGDKIVQLWRQMCIGNRLMAVEYQPDRTYWIEWLQAIKN